MKIKFAHIVITLLLLCPLFSRAEQTKDVHNFSTLSSYSEIVFTKTYNAATARGVTYTCTNSAFFGKDYFHSYGYQSISINLPIQGDFVTTSAIENLKRIQISFFFESSKQPDLQLQLSRDSVHWTDSLTTDVTVAGPVADIEFKGAPDRYYVRITNNSSNRKASIYQLTYYMDDGCQSKIYIPE